MASAAKTYQIDITTNPSVILQTAEPVASNIPSPISVAAIVAVTPIYYNFRQPSGPVTGAITGYTTGPETITLAGTYNSDQIKAGDIVVISGSTNNDGSYTVISVANAGGNTTITVLETIDPSVVDGNVTFTPHAGSPEANETGAQFGETYPYPTMTKLRFTLYDDTSHEIELQSVTNHPTWSTGTFAALQTAAAAINALL
jgi:hypothetical protein